MGALQAGWASCIRNAHSMTCHLPAVWFEIDQAALLQLGLPKALKYHASAGTFVT